MRKQKRWRQALFCAFRGVWHCIQNERHMKLHLVIAAVVLTAGVFCNFDALKFCILFLSIALVLTLEIVNTALERVVDLVSPERHPLAGLVKDIAAGAVLVASLIACIIGYFLFFQMH